MVSNIDSIEFHRDNSDFTCIWDTSKSIATALSCIELNRDKERMYITCSAPEHIREDIAKFTKKYPKNIRNVSEDKREITIRESDIKEGKINLFLHQLWEKGSAIHIKLNTTTDQNTKILANKWYGREERIF